MRSALTATFPALALLGLAAACGVGGAELPPGVVVHYKPGFAGSAESSPTGARLVRQLGGLEDPESVRYDPDQDVFFISNMYGIGSGKDGNGYIVKASAADPARAMMFAEGGKHGVTLDAPKGMALHGDTLWVADIDVLRGFDRTSGAPLATIDLEPQGAVLLNDVVLGPDGRIYTTDSGIIMSEKGVLEPGGDKIFAIGPGRRVSVVASGPQLEHPNGITWDPATRRMLVASFGTFHSQVYALTPGDSTHPVLVRGPGRFDGIEPAGDGRFLVACWRDSSVHLVGRGKDVQVVRNIPTPADIGYDAGRRRLAVPSTAGGKVLFWDLP